MNGKRAYPVPRPARAYLKLLGEELSSRGKEPELPLKTLPYLNDRMWGIPPRELMVIAARPSQGKTAFATQIAYDLASQGKPVLYLSLEMTVISILERLFCHHSRIDNQKIIKGGFRNYPNEWKAFEEHINNIPLIITQEMGKTWDELNEVIEAMAVKPRVIILDYIGLVSSDSQEKRYAIEDWIKNFRIMAIEYNFAGIVCAQINREGDAKGSDHLPSLRHIKETGCLEEHCDSALLLHYPCKYNAKEDPNAHTVILAKKRNGETGSIGMRFIPQYSLFEDDGKMPEIDENVATAMEVFNGRPFELTTAPDGKMPTMRKASNRY